MQRLKGKKILLAPYTPLTRAFAKKIEDTDIKIIGFIDSFRQDSNVYHPNQINNLHFDVVLIYNDLYFEAIYNDIVQHIKSSNIYRIYYDNKSSYKLFDYKAIEKQRRNKQIQQFKYTLYRILQKTISWLIDTLHITRKTNIFISEGATGSNLKFMYLYFHKENALNSILICKNENEMLELTQFGMRYLSYGSLHSHLLIALAKNIFVDQVPRRYYDALATDQNLIQLWHGVGLKKLHVSDAIEYDYFVSTSDWTNETNFKHVFKAKHFLSCGYPRNDIFFRDEDEKDLIFCDHNIYNLVRNTSKKCILYMPTYRDNNEDNLPPLNFELLDSQMAQINALFIIKLHPFVREKIISNPKQFSNIIFYNTDGDIYPILKYIDILISDYSSVIYDFLLLDRPIIGFIYDFERYQANREPFLFDYETYTPAHIVRTQEELTNALQYSDVMCKVRENIKRKFFNKYHNNSSYLIHQIIT